MYADGDQVNAGVTVGPNKDRSITDQWQSWSIPISELSKGNTPDIGNVTTLLFLRGEKNFDAKEIRIRNVYFSR